MAEPAEQMTTTRNVALEYARAGFPIFPCGPHKRPLIKDGLNAASSDLATVESWWSKYPDALVGLPTGEKSGLWVLDLDIAKDGNPPGDQTLRELGLEPVLADGIVVSTQSGGTHAYFKHEGYRNTAGDRGRGIGKGIDTRGEGGYVIAPGSPGYAFKRGGSAQSLRHARPIPVPLKRKLNERIAANGEKPAPPPNNVVRGIFSNCDLGPPYLAPGGDGGAWAEMALKLEIDGLKAVTKGGRNHALNEAAFALGQIVASGGLEKQRVQAELEAAALFIGLEREETAKTIKSGLEGGATQPRTAPARPEGGITVFGNQPLQSMSSAAMADSLPAGMVLDSAGRPRKRFAKGSAFALSDGSDIPRRSWLFGKHYIRKFVSSTISPGGVGKSSYTMAEALSMASGRKITGTFPAAEKLRVFVWNGEDPQDELERRMTALAIYHGVNPDDLGDRLVVRSGRDMPITLATQDRGGAVVDTALVEEMVADLADFDVIIVDPFVSSHAVNENDNGAIDQVVKTWGQIAERLNAAVELVHHSRKPAGGQSEAPTTDDDARGAGALKGAARAMRMLNRMTAKTAADFAIDENERWRHVRIDDGKQNMAPPAERATWFRMESEALPNGGELDEGDSVGVVVAWTPPDAFEGVTAEKGVRVIAELERMIAADEGHRARFDPQAADWFGHVVGEVLEIDSNTDHGSAKVKKILATWLKSDVLEKGRASCPDSKFRPVYVPGSERLTTSATT